MPSVVYLKNSVSQQLGSLNSKASWVSGKGLLSGHRRHLALAEANLFRRVSLRIYPFLQRPSPGQNVKGGAWQGAAQ